MTRDPEFRIEKIEVYRVVDERGDAVCIEDDHGCYPMHFGCYEEALEEVVRRSRLSVHGPLTKEQHEYAETMRPVRERMDRALQNRIMANLMRPSPLLKSFR